MHLWSQLVIQPQLKESEKSKRDTYVADGGKGNVTCFAREQLNQIAELKDCQTPLLCRLKAG